MRLTAVYSVACFERFLADYRELALYETLSAKEAKID